MSITEGMSEHWGNYLVSDPFKFKLIKFLKKIIKKITRWIPFKRKKFLMKVRVYGEVSFPFEMKIPVKGERDIFKQLWLILEDE